MKTVAYDTETTGLNAYLGKTMFSYSTCNEDGYTDVKRIDKPLKKAQQNLEHLRKFWANTNIAKVMHNAKFDLTFTEKLLGKRLAEKTTIHDTFVQSHLLNNSHPTHRLKALAWEMAGVPTDDETTVKQFARGGDYSTVPDDIMDAYQARDAERTMLLHLFFYPRIKRHRRTLEIYNMEMELQKATIRMEGRGVMLNRSACKKLIEKLQGDSNAILDEVEKEYGQRINLGKPSQIRWLLFSEMNLPVLKRTPTGIPSVDKDVLPLLREEIGSTVPILEGVLKYRSWTRGISMLSSYLDLTDEDNIIHSDIKTCGAKTGRESCSRPNLQNVEKTGVLTNPYPIPARTVFMPRPGYVNFHIDYAAIELRLLVDYSKDAKMIKEIAGADGAGDPHALAGRIFYPAFTPGELEAYGAVDDMIKNGFEATKGDARKTLRDAAKALNFAIPYGAGPNKAGKILGVPLTLGARRYEVYKNIFPGLCRLSKTVGEQARADGYVETKFGRRIFMVREKAYVATNFLIQGTAAGILKRAQVRVHKYLEEATGGEVKILLPIHDELIIEYPRKRLREARELFSEVRELMLDFPLFEVPMEVVVSVATINWARKKKFDLKEN